MAIKNELTITSINTLSNIELKAELTTMLSVVNNVSKNMWSYARAMTSIIDGELFKEDFKTQKGFASYVNLSQSSISNYVNAVHFIDAHQEMTEKWFSSLPILSIGKAYMLSTLSSEQYNAFDDAFHSFELENEDLLYLSMSDKEFKDIVRHYKEMSFDTPQETETSQETEAKQETEVKQETEAKQETEIEPQETVADPQETKELKELAEKELRLSDEILIILEKKLNAGRKLTAFEDTVLDYVYTVSKLKKEMN